VADPAAPLGVLVLGRDAAASELGRELAAHRSFRVVDVRDELEGAASLDGVDAVWAAGPAAGRLDAALAALRAGRHLLLSPPAQAEPARLAELARTAASAGLCAAAVHRRFSPQVVRAAELVASGRLGLPWALQLHLVEPGAGDGAAARLLAEGVDVVRAVTGLEVESVHAVASGAVAPQALLVASLALSRGALATIVAGRSDTRDRAGGGLGRLLLAGSQGMLCLEEDRPRLVVRSNVRESASRVGDGRAAGWIARGLLDDLAHALRGGAEPACGLLDAGRALAAAQAAAESARTGATIRIEDVPGGE
jgi:predicted dehydrogenase